MKRSEKVIIGIDASRNRSGGAIAHLIGVLSEYKPHTHKIDEIHIWTYKALAEKIPDRPYIIKHTPKSLEKSLFRQVIWQMLFLPGELKASKCNILFTTDASTLCRFKPHIVLSQDLLSYEPGVMRSFGISLATLRLYLILRIQNYAFRHADGVIFLTKYASELIQSSCGHLKKTIIIPHGVNPEFKCLNISIPEKNPLSFSCIYVSNADMYKNQWNVIDAIFILRNQGFDMNLKLIGGGIGKAQQLIDKTLDHLDPERNFVQQYGFLPIEGIMEHMKSADISIFASSCENMPVTLIESMAAGLPIACSDRGPMPEVLKDGGLYFDPEDAESIASALNKLIIDTELRKNLSSRAKAISESFTWSRCSHETFRFITQFVINENN